MSRPADLKTRKRLRVQSQGLLNDGGVQSSGVLQLIDEALVAATSTESSLADRSLPLTLLSDLFDYTPLQQCPEIVAYIETNEAKIRKCLEGKDAMPPKLGLLTMCKKLTGFTLSIIYI